MMDNLNYVFYSTNIKPTKKLLLLCICKLSDAHGETCCTQRELAEMACLSRERVNILLHELHDERIIILTPRIGQNGAMLSNKITLNLKALCG